MATREFSANDTVEIWRLLNEVRGWIDDLAEAGVTARYWVGRPSVDDRAYQNGVNRVATCWSRRLSPFGLAGLFLLPGLYLASYALSWVLWLVPGGNPGYENGWYSAYLYLGLTAFVVIAAFIPSRSVVVVKVPQGGRA